MNPIDIALSRNQSAFIASGHGTRLDVLSGADVGKTFYSILDVEPQIIAEGELGSDPREASKVRFAEPFPDLGFGDLLKSYNATWKVLGRANNAADVTVDYYVEQQI